MESIKLSYDSESEIPEKHKELYTEKDGKFVLSGVEGLKTEQDVINVKHALDSERELRAKFERESKEREAELSGLRKDIEDKEESLKREALNKAKNPEEVEKLKAEIESLEIKKRDAELEDIKKKLEDKESAYQELSANVKKEKLENGATAALLAAGINPDAISVGLKAFNLGFDVSESGEVVHSESGKKANELAVDFLKSNPYLMPSNTANNNPGKPPESKGIKPHNSTIADAISNAPVEKMNIT